MTPKPKYPANADPGKVDTYTDAQFRALITYIMSKDASAGLPYGAHGENWPKAINKGESRHTAGLVIIQQYLALHGTAVPKTDQPYPNPDPGEAQAGLGPTGIGFGSITSILDFLKLLTEASTWLRVAEVLLGMLLVGAGLAKMSQKAAVVIGQVPLAGKALT